MQLNQHQFCSIAIPKKHDKGSDFEFYGGLEKSTQ